MLDVSDENDEWINEEQKYLYKILKPSIICEAYGDRGGLRE